MPTDRVPTAPRPKEGAYSVSRVSILSLGSLGHYGTPTGRGGRGLIGQADDGVLVAAVALRANTFEGHVDPDAASPPFSLH